MMCDNLEGKESEKEQTDPNARLIHLAVHLRLTQRCKPVNQLYSETTLVIMITSDVNGPNVPIKRHSGRLDKKQAPTIRRLHETHLRAKNTCTLKMRRWKKLFHVNGNDRKAGVTILTSDKTSLKPRP